MCFEVARMKLNRHLTPMSSPDSLLSFSRSEFASCSLYGRPGPLRGPLPVRTKLLLVLVVFTDACEMALCRACGNVLFF